MSVTYTKQQRDFAVRQDVPLVTIEVTGPSGKGKMNFQGPASMDEAKDITAFLLAYLKRRAERLEQAETETASKRPQHTEQPR